MGQNEPDSDLSPALKAIQDRVESNPRNEMMRRFEQDLAKDRVHSGPAVLYLFAVGLGGLALGGAIGAIAHGRPEISFLVDPNLLLIAIAALAGAALFVGLFARQQRVKARRYSRRTSGVVSSSRISSKAGGSEGASGHRISFLVCTVTYEADGQQHTVRWEPGAAISNVDKYLGRVVTVCFDPDSVDEATVGRPDQAFLTLCLAYAFLCLLTGAAIYLRQYPLF